MIEFTVYVWEVDVTLRILLYDMLYARWSKMWKHIVKNEL